MDVIDSFRGPYSFLSNFYFADVTYNGYTYKSSEYAFQAAKTTNQADHDYIVSATTKELKRRAHEIKDRWRPDWHSVKITIMAEIVYHKFNQNPHLYAQLKATNGAILIEGNWWRDDFWGMYEGKGQNILGKILMIVRDLK